MGGCFVNPNLNNLSSVGRVDDGGDRIIIEGLPYSLTEPQIRNLLEAFGPLRDFHLVRHPETQNSLGYAFCIYQDSSVTDFACAGLNRITIADNTLFARRASHLQATTHHHPKPDEHELLHSQNQIALQRLSLAPDARSERKRMSGFDMAPGLEGPDRRIFVGGLLDYFTESDIRELLESFGPLRGFHLVRDPQTGNSKGYAYCVYQDSSVTDIACAALNGIRMGAKTLIVRRASLQDTTHDPKPDFEDALLRAQNDLQRRFLATPPTKVVCLVRVVNNRDRLKHDDYYHQDLVQYMTIKCGKFGSLVSVVIPRSSPDGAIGHGVGNVFLEYVDTQSAIKARQGLHGRLNFGGIYVVALYYSENKFSNGDYSG